jgi:hypothetical protein
MTAWGKEHEVDAMRNMLTQFPNGLVACVSDSYNIWYDLISNRETKSRKTTANACATPGKPAASCGVVSSRTWWLHVVIGTAR